MEKAIDPVCKMRVAERQFPYVYKGKIYSFCSKICREKFEENPEKYLKDETWPKT